jgi:malic enzyme
MSESSVKFSEQEALNFHSQGGPGKIEVIASKPMATQRDLSLAYSPGVAVRSAPSPPIRLPLMITPPRAISSP